MIGLRDNTEWALQADNVLLIGPSGVGKFHIAAALRATSDRTRNPGEMATGHRTGAIITTGPAGPELDGGDEQAG